MVNCVFCNIAKGKVYSAKVYDDKDFLAFMDRSPVNTGHVLVIPKAHIPNFEDINDKNLSKLLIIVKKISKAIKEITKCKKVGILIAGFDIPHTHIHVIPMFNIKDVCTRRMFENKFDIAPNEKLAEIAEKIRLNLKT